jgi:formyltetrahydrofolate dehydrogenase
VDTLYNRFLYPEGVKAMGEAVQMVADGDAPRIPQTEEGASYEPIVKKDDAEIRWNLSASELHDFIRGNDRSPGAWVRIDGEKISLFGSRIWTGPLAPYGSRDVSVDGGKAVIHDGGMLLFAADGKPVNVVSVWPENGKMMHATDYGRDASKEVKMEELKLDETEQQMVDALKDIWARMLGVADASSISDKSDFFKMGAGSMEVVRLVEEIRARCGGIRLQAEDVYMSPTFEEIVRLIVMKSRGVHGGEKSVQYDGITRSIGSATIRFPRQLFIDNKFADASDGSTFDTINPYDETVICSVAKGTPEDVDRGVAAARRAFLGDWGRMNARDRGNLLHRLADLLHEHREELAMIESLDSGAVYTLALKTHVGMSVDAFRL